MSKVLLLWLHFFLWMFLEFIVNKKLKVQKIFLVVYKIKTKDLKWLVSRLF